MEASLSLELEEESMIIPYTRVNVGVGFMCHFKKYLAKVLCFSYSYPEIY